MPTLSALAAKSLEPGQTMRITLRGNSMVPFLFDGDLLEIKKQDGLHRGDIVVFDLDGTLVAHRIVRISNAAITARGDACRQSETVNREEIAGKVMTVVRGSRRFEMVSLPAKVYNWCLPLSSLALRAYRKYLSS